MSTRHHSRQRLPARRNLRKHLFEQLEARYLLSGSSGGLEAEGEGSDGTVILSKLYAGLGQLETVFEKVGEAAETFAPAPELAGKKLIKTGLAELVDLPGAVRLLTDKIYTAPRIRFADGKTNSADPNFSIPAGSILAYQIVVDRGAPLQLLATAPTLPTSSTIVQRADAWVSALNASLAAVPQLNSSLVWSRETGVPGELGPVLTLSARTDAVTGRSAFSSVEFITARIDGNMAGSAIGQANGDLTFEIRDLSLRTLDGVSQTNLGVSTPLVIENKQVTVARSASDLKASKTNDNVSLQDLADDINAALAKVDIRFPQQFSGANSTIPESGPPAKNRTLATYLYAAVSNLSGPQRIVLLARTGNVERFRLVGTGLEALGFSGTDFETFDLSLPAHLNLGLRGQVAVRDVDRQLFANAAAATNNEAIASAVAAVVQKFVPSADHGKIVIDKDAAGKPIRVNFPIALTSHKKVSIAELDFSRSFDLFSTTTGSPSSSKQGPSNQDAGPAGDTQTAGQAPATVETTVVSCEVMASVNLQPTDGSPIALDYPLHELDERRGLRALVGVVAPFAMPNANGRLTNTDITFTINYTRESDDRVKDFSFSLNRNATSDNSSLQDLIDDINARLAGATLNDPQTPSLEALLIDGRFALRTVDRDVNGFLLTASRNVARALGMLESTTSGPPQPPTASLVSNGKPSNDAPRTDPLYNRFHDLVVEVWPQGSTQATTYYVDLDTTFNIDGVLGRLTLQLPFGASFARLEGSRLKLIAQDRFRISAATLAGETSYAGEALGILGEARQDGAAWVLLGEDLDQVSNSNSVSLSPNPQNPLTVQIDVTVGGPATASPTPVATNPLLTSSVALASAPDLGMVLGVTTGSATLFAEPTRDAQGNVQPLKLKYKLPLNLKDPGQGSANNGSITLEEALRADPEKLFGPMVATELTASGQLDLKGEFFDLHSPNSGQILPLDFKFANANDLKSLKFEVNTTQPASQIKLEKLKQYRQLDVIEVVDTFRQAISRLSDPNSPMTRALRNDLPVVGTSFGELFDFVAELDAALDEIVATISPDDLIGGVNDFESALANLPVTNSIKRRVMLATDELRGELVQLRLALNDGQGVLQAVARVMASTTQVQREVRRLPGVPATGVPSGSGATNDIVRELVVAADTLGGFLPAINTLAVRATEALQAHLPQIDGVEFKLEIVPDFDGSVTNASDLAVVMGIVLDEQVALAFDPAVANTSFGPFDFELDGRLSASARARVQLGMATRFIASGPRLYVLANPTGSDLRVATGVELSGLLPNASLDGQVRLGSFDLVTGTLRASLMDPATSTPAQPAPASLKFGLSGSTAPGPLNGILLGDLANANIVPTASGQLQMGADVSLLGRTVQDAVRLDFNLSSLTGTAVPLNWTVKEAELAGLFTDFDFDLATIIAGVDEFLKQLESVLQQRLSGMPLIGTELNDLGGYIQSVRELILPQLRSVLESAGVKNLAELTSLIRNQLFNILDPSQSSNFFKLLDGNDSGTNVTPEDIGVILDRQQFQITAYLGFSQQLSEDIDFNTNLLGLPLSAAGKGGVQLTVDAVAFVGLGIDPRNGFYLVPNTSSTPISAPATSVTLAPGQELAARVSANLATATSLELDLFLFSVNATDRGSTLSLNVGIDLGAGSNGRIRLSELAPTFVGNGNASLDLDLAAIVTSGLPELSAKLKANWSVTFGPGGIQTVPGTGSFRLENLRLNLGQLLEKTVGRAAAEINQVLAPIQEVIALLKTEIPGVSELAKLAGRKDPVTLLALALNELPPDVASEALRFVNFLEALGNLSSRLSSANGALLEFAPIDFGNKFLTPNWNTQPDAVPSLGNVPLPPSVDRLLKEFRRRPDEQAASVGVGGVPADGLDLSFPILDDPANFVKLLLGQAQDLVVWNIPKLNLDFGWSQAFPVLPFPPISVEVALNSMFSLALGVGLDSRGLQTDNLLDGFYINDLRDGRDVDEAQFSLSVSAAALLDVAIASVGLQGEIVGDISANLRDSDADGKLYVDEIAEIVQQQGIDCLFDFTAELRAQLALIWELDLFLTSIDGTIDIVDLVLFNESNRGSCPAEIPAHVSNGLASGVPDGSRTFSNQLPVHIAEFLGASAPNGIAPAGTLILHAGAFAHQRVLGKSRDTSEVFTVTQLAPNVVSVSGMGLEAKFGDVQRIIFDGGLGNDQLLLKVGESGDENSYRQFSIPIVAFGGEGNDTLFGGGLFDSLFGGPGGDEIKAGPGDDYVDGGSGNDSIYGDDGNDTLLGREGDDFIYGEGGQDILEGGEGNDRLWGGYLDNANPVAGREADSHDSIDGGAHQDHLYGGLGNDRLWGRGGNDWLYGHAGSDYLDGGDGHDFLDAGTDDDPWVHGGLGNDFVMGGEGADKLLGGWGNDVLIAHVLDNTIGGSASDWLEGGPDNDFICGSNGPDIIYGGTSSLGYDGVTTDFLPVPFGETRYPVLSGGYYLKSCTAPGPPNLPEPLPGGVVLRVFRDLNQDRIKNDEEFFDNGQLIRVSDSDGRQVGEFTSADVDVNGDGRIDLLTERGVVYVPQLPPGTYQAEVVLPATTPGQPSQIRVTTPQAGPSLRPVLAVTVSDAQTVYGGEFGIYKETLVQGFVWRDLNGNQQRDANEGVAGRTVYLDQYPLEPSGGPNGKYDGQGEEFATTGPDGSYTLRASSASGPTYVRLRDSVDQLAPAEVIAYGPTNFSNGSIGSEWQAPSGRIAISPNNNLFHGQFGNETTTLTLNNLPDHEELTLTFDLYIIGGWTGSGPQGVGEDDRFRLSIPGGFGIDATFSNITNAGEFGTYRQSYPSPNSPARTGSSGATLGYPVNSVYNVIRNFEHFGSSIAIAFSGLNLEPGETWGIDNVQVRARRGGHLINIQSEAVYAGRDFRITAPIGPLLNSQYQSVPQALGEQPMRSELGPVGSSMTIAGAKSGSGLAAASTTAGFVSGIRFNDVNQNGFLDAGEPRIRDQIVYVDLNGNGERDDEEPWTLTSPAGEYFFELPAGTYTIRETLPEGWEETAPGGRPFAISETGQLTELDPSTGATVHTRMIASPVSISQWTGLAYDPALDKLLAIGNPSSGNTYLFEVDPLTAEAVVRTRLSQRLSEGDLAVEPGTGRLLAVSARTGSGAWLVEINKQTGTVTDQAILQAEFEGGATDPSAMAFQPNGLLYVVDRNYSRLYRFDRATGSVTSNPLLPQNSNNIGRVAGMVWHATSATGGNLRLAAGSPNLNFSPPDRVPSLYQLSTAGSISSLSTTALAEHLSGMTLVPRMGNIVTLAAGAGGLIQDVSGKNFGNLPIAYIWDGQDTVAGHSGDDDIWGDNVLNRPRTRLIGDDDTLIGGLGNDDLFGQQKEDQLWGGPDTPPLSTPNNDVDNLDGGEGYNQVVQWASGNQVLENNRLLGQADGLRLVWDSLVNIYSAELKAGASGNILDATAFTLGPVTLTGGPGADTLLGSPQNDRLEGHGGIDTLDGRSGDDVYLFAADLPLNIDSIVGSPGNDTVDFSASFSKVQVNLSVFGTNPATNLQTINSNLQLRLLAEDAAENIVGGSGDDVLTGNSLANRIDGGPGSDRMLGLEGANTFVFSDPKGDAVERDEVAGGTSLNDQLDFSALSASYALTIDFRNGGANLLSPYATVRQGTTTRRTVIRSGATSTIEQAVGTAGDDVFYDGPGAQTYEGLGGNDTYVLANNNDVDHIIEQNDGGIDRLDFSSFTTPLRIDLNSTASLARRNTSNPFDIDAETTNLPQRVTSNTDSLEQVIGGSGRDRIFGNEGDNYIDGGLGADKLEGRLGNDLYVYRNNTISGVGDQIEETSDGGVDTISFGETDPVNGAVVVDLGAGTATIGTFSVIFPPSSLENATGGSGNDSLTGSNLANRLIGGAGNDTLDGVASSNVLIGGTGNDTYRFRQLLGTSFGTGFVFVPDIGQIFDPDVLLNSQGLPLLNSSGELQVVDGGSDTIDLSNVNNAPVVRVNLSGLVDVPLIEHQDIRPVAGGTPVRQVTPGYLEFGGQRYLTWIENVNGSPAADIIVGNDRDNVLSGGGGNNQLSGGRGNDRYRFNWGLTSDDRLVEDADAVIGSLLTTSGVDTLDFSNATGTGTLTFNLNVPTDATNNAASPRAGTTIRLRDSSPGNPWRSAGFEILVGDQDQANNLTGHEYNSGLIGGNVLIGGSASDALNGLSGHDILIGFQGVDNLQGGNSDDILIGGWVDFVGDGLGLNNLDRELAAIIAIRRAWLGGGSLASRQAAIQAGVGNAPLNARLVEGVTVFNDNAADLVSGGNGQNWIIESSTGPLMTLPTKPFTGSYLPLSETAQQLATRPTVPQLPENQPSILLTSRIFREAKLTTSNPGNESTSSFRSNPFSLLAIDEDEETEIVGLLAHNRLRTRFVN